MGHAACLVAFAAHGASTPVIGLLATFLEKRNMTVRVGNCFSAPKPVNGGCPQGSIMGVYLFNICSDNLEVQGVNPRRVLNEDKLPDIGAFFDAADRDRFSLASLSGEGFGEDSIGAGGGLSDGEDLVESGLEGPDESLVTPSRIRCIGSVGRWRRVLRLLAA